MRHKPCRISEKVRAYSICTKIQGNDIIYKRTYVLISKYITYRRRNTCASRDILISLVGEIICHGRSDGCPCGGRARPNQSADQRHDVIASHYTPTTRAIYLHPTISGFDQRSCTQGPHRLAFIISFVIVVFVVYTLDFIFVVGLDRRVRQTYVLSMSRPMVLSKFVSI